MYTIHAHFYRFADVNFGSLIGAVGVYIIWDAQAIAKPTYIGEGIVLKRFTEHTRRDTRRFPRPWHGYVALISGSTRGVHKYESLAIERLLLDVARDTDRLPSANRRPGSAKAVVSFCRNELLRVFVRGFDPLLPPREARPLQRPKLIDAWLKDERPYTFAHDWRLRRLRS
jgi:hypothetical protein